MSIHAALSIFHSSAALGERGLYPIRHTVFVLWVLLPAFASGLAFVNRSGGYTTSGAYCYLPIRPFWYRLALSWIPRYLILVMIASIYLAIYLFVKRNFNHYHLSEHSSDKLPSSGHGRQSTRLPVSRKSEGEVSGSRVPTSTEPSYPNQDLRTIAEHNDEKGDHRTTPAWERYTFGAATPLAKPAESDIVTTDPSILKTS
jgi:G protein-coupled receptor GPR1